MFYVPLLANVERCTTSSLCKEIFKVFGGCSDCDRITTYRLGISNVRLSEMSLLSAVQRGMNRMKWCGNPDRRHLPVLCQRLKSLTTFRDMGEDVWYDRPHDGKGFQQLSGLT